MLGYARCGGGAYFNGRPAARPCAPPLSGDGRAERCSSVGFTAPLGLRAAITLLDDRLIAVHGMSRHIFVNIDRRITRDDCILRTRHVVRHDTYQTVGT